MIQSVAARRVDSSSKGTTVASERSTVATTLLCEYVYLCRTNCKLVFCWSVFLARLLAQWLILISLAFKSFFFLCSSSLPGGCEYSYVAGSYEERTPAVFSLFSLRHPGIFQVNRNPEGEPCTYKYSRCFVLLYV